jgi:hypothetical protein
MPQMFGMLERSSEEGGGSGLPTWLSSHPDPGTRRQRISGEVTRLQAEGRMPLPARIERDAYLERLTGLPYGPLPMAGGGAAGAGLAEGGDASGGDGEPLLARIGVARVDEDLSLEEFAGRYCAPGVPLATVALLNRLPADGVVPAGTLAKRVVGETEEPRGGQRVFRKGG